MAYTPTNWKDRDVENPRTYTARQNEDGSITFFDAPRTINEAGTPVNAVNMNKIEEQLYKNDLERKITNCITEIPQDIKLELVDGTLTLKAGSKVYVPNGFEADGVTPKFDVVVVDSDVSLNPSANFVSSTVFVFFKFSTNTLIFCDPLTQAFSGTTQPTSTIVRYWLDTNTNLMKVTGNSGETWSIGETSLPLCILNVDASADTVKSIDQVFNGFGYIGSTVFALPNVKGLIPNGRNEDGSLRNIEFTVDRVLTRTRDLTGTNAPLVLNANDFSNYGVADYNEELNLNISSAGTDTGRAIVGTWSATDGVITSFTPKLPFHAVDRNDSSWVSAQAMPGGKYIDLTLGASGTNYTAPANGYFFVDKSAGVTGAFLYLSNNTGKIGSEYAITNATSNHCRVYIPAKKGDVVNISYNITGTTHSFRFVYAEGEE